MTETSIAQQRNRLLRRVLTAASAGNSIERYDSALWPGSRPITNGARARRSGYGTGRLVLPSGSTRVTTPSGKPQPRSTAPKGFGRDRHNR